MAVELEQTIMREIGLGQHYYWFNGSGSCAHIRRKAVDSLAEAMSKHGLTLAPAWAKHCQIATQADQFDGDKYTLTNTWVACSNAIRDGIDRKNGSKGFKPRDNFQFFHSEKRKQWR